MATVTGSKKNARNARPSDRLDLTDVGLRAYVDSGGTHTLVRITKDRLEWVKIMPCEVAEQELDTSWVAEVDEEAREAQPSKPIDFIMVKQGDRMVSRLTTSEDERAKRRVLRRQARQLRKKKRQDKIKVIKARKVRLN